MLTMKAFLSKKNHKMKLRKSILWIFVYIFLLTEAKPVPDGEGEEEEGEDEEEEDVYEEEEEVSTTTTTTVQPENENVNATEEVNNDRNDELEDIQNTTLSSTTATAVVNASNITITNATVEEILESTTVTATTSNTSTEVVVMEIEKPQDAPEVTTTKKPPTRVIMLTLATGENVTIHIAGVEGQSETMNENYNIESAIIKALQSARKSNATEEKRNDIQVMMEIEDVPTTTSTTTTTRTSTTTTESIPPPAVTRLETDIKSTSTTTTTTTKLPALYQASFIQKRTTTPLPTVYQAFKKLIQTQWFKNEVVNVGCFGFGFCEEEWRNVEKGELPTDNNDDD